MRNSNGRGGGVLLYPDIFSRKTSSFWSAIFKTIKIRSIVIFDSTLYFLTLAVREIGRMSSLFKRSQRKVLLCGGLLGGPI